MKKYCNPSHYTTLCNKYAGYMEELHTTQGKTKENDTNKSLIRKYYVDTKNLHK